MHKPWPPYLHCHLRHSWNVGTIPQPHPCASLQTLLMVVTGQVLAAVGLAGLGRRALYPEQLTPASLQLSQSELFLCYFPLQSTLA